MSKGKKTFFKKHAPLLAARDGGWFCHYCGHKLVPADAVAREPYFSYELRQQDLSNYTLEQRLAWERGEFREWIGVWTLNNREYRSPTIDHKLATSKGGGHEMTNLVLACGDCNNEKSNRYSYDEYLILRQKREKTPHV